MRPKHGFTRILLVSGDRETEVKRLADAVSISEVYAETSPEEKVEIVRRETEHAQTLFVGDGINDAPALMAATVGIAFGQHSDVTSEAARVVIIDTFAAFGMLSPVPGAVAQEGIDLIAVLNALRTATAASTLTDFRTE